MTDPGYQGAPTPENPQSSAPQTPGVPGQYVPPAGGPVPPGPAAPPPGYPSADDKQWALIAHFGGAAGALFCGVLSFVAPLIAYFSKANQPTAKAHAAAALNFQILVSGVAIVLVIIRYGLLATMSLSGIGLAFLLSLLSFVVLVLGIVFGVIGGMKANEGQLYKYPVSLGIFK